MFIEISDYLKCPEIHDEEPCIVLPDVMSDRFVLSGLVGCPVCRREYPIRDGRAIFGEPTGATIDQDLDPEIVRALLGLESPGGYVGLVGVAVELADSLAENMKAHFVGFNAPPQYRGGEGISLMDTAGLLPLKTSSVRGVVLDAAHVGIPWLAEATRIVLPGQRVVVASEEVTATGLGEMLVGPEEMLVGLEEMAVGHGYWVGRKT